MNHVHEFIEAEVLAPLPENLRSFLCDSAVLGTVTADLAAEITGEPASAELLERHFDSVLIHDVGLDTYHFHPSADGMRPQHLHAPRPATPAEHHR